MKRIAILLAFLTTLAAVPSAAQPNSSGVYNGQSRGDWWLVDTYAGRGQAVLVEGQPHSKTDGTTAYMAYLMDSAAKADGQIGIVVGLIVHCANRTVQSGSFWNIYADGRTESTRGFYSQPNPLQPDSALYRFACATDRTSFRHFPDRVLSDVVTEIFAPPPRN